MYKYKQITILLVFVFVVLCIFLIQKEEREIETFVPAIQKIYQPHVRNARLFTNRIKTNIGKSFSMFTKKYGLSS